MTSRDFCFWLQGFFEVANPDKLTEAQAEMVKAHLNLVFKHEIDPSMGDAKHQNELNAIHNQSPKTFVKKPLYPDENGEKMRC